MRHSTETCVCFLVAIACLVQQTDGSSCLFKASLQIGSQCHIANKSSVYLKTSTGLDFVGYCNNALIPEWNCMVPMLRPCIEELGLDSSVMSAVPAILRKMCLGLQEFIDPMSTRSCSRNHVFMSSCVRGSGLLELLAISDSSRFPGINFFCDGRISTMLQCLAPEIRDCSELFGVPLNLTSILNAVEMTCKFLTKEPDCDVLRIWQTGQSCVSQARRMSNLAPDVPLNLNVMCQSNVVSKVIDCMGTDITACGRMFALRVGTINAKMLAHMVCDYLSTVTMEQRLCVQQQYPLWLEVYSEQGSTVMKNMIASLAKGPNFTVEGVFESYFCGIRQLLDKTVPVTFGKCENVIPIFEMFMTVALPRRCPILIGGDT